MSNPRILLIYNADTGLIPTVRDWLHKLFRPATYPCRLCALTHGPFTMHRAWAATLASLPHSHIALHRDDWLAQFPSGAQTTPLPAILLQDGEILTPLVNAADFETLSTLPQLQALLASRLATT